MSLEQFLWRVTRLDNGLYETVISAIKPTVAPSDSGAIIASQTIILESRFVSVISDGYTNIESTLADNQAIKITASNVVGGIDIDAGTGGITVDTTNGISLDAGAESNFSTSVGNLIFSSAGLVNIESNSGGINMCTNNVVQTLNLGTGAANKFINIGSNTGTTSVSVNTGTGGYSLDTLAGGAISIDAVGASSNFTLTGTANAQDLTIAVQGGYDASLVLTSTGTAADAIIIAATNAGGGIDIDCSTGGYRLDTTGQCYLASSQAGGGSITLDASSGGLTFSGGPFGIAINSGGSLIGIGHWNGGDIQFGNAAVARTITIGNITGSTGIVINSGTGGINIGGNSSTGNIDIGNTSIAKSIYIGNTTGGSRTFFRRGTGGFIKTQPAHTTVADADEVLAVWKLLTGIIIGIPTANRTLTLPTAADLVSGMPGVDIDDSIDFTFINNNTTNNAEFIIVANTGGTLEGNERVSPRENILNTYKNSGSSIFRLRFTNVTISTESYTVYRIS